MPNELPRHQNRIRETKERDVSHAGTSCHTRHELPRQHNKSVRDHATSADKPNGEEGNIW